MICLSALPMSCCVFLLNISDIHTLIINIIYLLSPCSGIVYHGNNIRRGTGLRWVEGPTSFWVSWFYDRLLGQSVFVSLLQNNDIMVTGKWPNMHS